MSAGGPAPRASLRPPQSAEMDEASLSQVLSTYGPYRSAAARAPEAATTRGVAPPPTPPSEAETLIAAPVYATGIERSPQASARLQPEPRHGPEAGRVEVAPRVEVEERGTPGFGVILAAAAASLLGAAVFLSFASTGGDPAEASLSEFDSGIPAELAAAIAEPPEPFSEPPSAAAPALEEGPNDPPSDPEPVGVRVSFSPRSGRPSATTTLETDALRRLARCRRGITIVGRAGDVEKRRRRRLAWRRADIVRRQLASVGVDERRLRLEVDVLAPAAAEVELRCSSESGSQ